MKAKESDPQTKKTRPSISDEEFEPKPVSTNGKGHPLSFLSNLPTAPLSSIIEIYTDTLKVYMCDIYSIKHLSSDS